MDADELTSELKLLSKTPRACSYYRVDLHVHSPASSDYEGDKEISPYEFIREFVSRGLDLIAIADHNTGGYIDQAIEARNEIASREGRNITVLPGVELHASPGIHILAILPDGGTGAVTDLLSRLGLPSNQHGDNTKLISQPIGEISRIVRERRGLLIGAHCNSTKGVVQELSGQARLEWLRSLDALEINSESGEDKALKTIEYVTRDLKVVIPFTFGSDSHDSASDTTGMWVKMAEPSFTCLRQLTFEPQLRVSRAEPAAHAHGWIAGFTTTHGVYAGERFRFSPHLNALLGGRGAGKSAAIDLLRFAFEADPQASEDNSAVFTNRIMGFLRSVGEVCVLVVGTDGETYVITRDGTYEIPNARANPIFTGSARVFQVSDDKLIERDLRPQEVLGIEFYGQGEVARLASRVDEQLRLIDENLDHSVVAASVEAAEKQLTANEEQLLKHNQRLEGLQAEAAARPELEERRRNLAKSLEDPIFEERSKWDSESIWMESQENWAKDILSRLPESVPPRPEDSVDIQESSAKAVLEKVKHAAVRISDSARDDLVSFRKTIAESLSELRGYRTEWNTEFETAKERYRARLAELGATSLAHAAAEKSGVEQDLTRIEISVEPEIVQIESEIASLQDQRSGLLKKLKSARWAIRQSRSQFVEELNSRMGGDVMVDLSGNNTSMYFDAIDGSLQGSGMLNRENQLSLACETLTPERLVEIIRSKAISELTAIGVTENNASRMINGLTDKVLYKIERVDVAQLPRIRIKREGESEYTDLSSLSVGEKCSAILSIALLSKGKPLVIDQPEDDLDHAFIINSIVGGIRTAKSGRQIIAATHNPNIPVLGDAEMVFRVARRAGEDVCQIQNSGGLELPHVTAEVQGLEGGAEAFERRRQRYSGVP